MSKELFAGAVLLSLLGSVGAKPATAQAQQEFVVGKVQEQMQALRPFSAAGSPDPAVLRASYKPLPCGLMFSTLGEELAYNPKYSKVGYADWQERLKKVMEHTTIPLRVCFERGKAAATYVVNGVIRANNIYVLRARRSQCTRYLLVGHIEPGEETVPNLALLRAVVVERGSDVGSFPSGRFSHRAESRVQATNLARRVALWPVPNEQDSKHCYTPWR